MKLNNRRDTGQLFVNKVSTPPRYFEHKAVLRRVCALMSLVSIASKVSQTLSTTSCGVFHVWKSFGLLDYCCLMKWIHVRGLYDS